MAFASIYVPEFWVQAILRSELTLRAERELRGCAIALVDGTPPIWKVVAANRAALTLGIEIGMARPAGGTISWRANPAAFCGAGKNCARGIA